MCDYISYCVKCHDKVISFNPNILQELQNGRWNEFSSSLKETFQIERYEDGTPKKMVVTEDVLFCLGKWLELLTLKLQESYGEVIQGLTEVFRSLRNCISNLDSQKYVVEHTDILMTCNSIFLRLVEKDKNSLCLKILLQFLVNLISSNREATEKVHDIFLKKIKECLKNGIHVYENSALIYNIALLVPFQDIELINIMFEKYNSDAHRNEFQIFFLEYNISKNYFWDEYKQFKLEDKITILELLRHMQLQQKTHNLPLTGLEILINAYLNSLDVIFQVNQEKKIDKTYEVSLILEIVSSFSSNEYYLKILQDSKDLLIKTGVLLINIHKLGKLSDNCFTPVQKLSEFKEKTHLNEHPAFGFKADLIRLIGNLCWKNIELQNLVRSLELIPVVLDCCNMDAKNPFIIQWVILAVRNLCENNLENQKLIASLHQKGAVSSEVLNELGISLHSDGDSSVKIVSLDTLKDDCGRNN